jgi:hypothetical protein
MLPEFVIIGAQKSGSTFLQLCLQEHPDIFLPKDEIPFFENPDYKNSSLGDLKKYFKNFHDRIKGIKRPNYLAKPEVPKRIQKDLPDAQLIVVLRDPIERAISAYFHNIKYGFIPPVPVEEGMRNIINGKYADEYPRSNEIIEFGYYYKHLRRYTYYLEKGDLLVLKSSEMFQNKRSTITNVYNFLGVDVNYEPLNTNKRPQKVVYNINRLKILQSINNNLYEYFDKGKRLRKREMGILDNLKVYSIKVFDYLIFRHFYSNKKPCISEELYESLKTMYHKDVQKLSEFTELDFSDWLRYEGYKERFSG